MDTTDTILCRVLGMTDAIFWPLRTWAAPLPANVYYARLEFGKAGAPWRSGENSEAGRKGVQRELEGLADSGLVKVFRPRKGRTLGVRLTDAGDARARALCGFSGVPETLAILAEVERMAAGTPDGWVGETWLAGVEYGQPNTRDELMHIGDMVLPALARHWLDSNSTVQGHTCFRVLPAGRDALANRPEPPPDGPPVHEDADSDDADAAYAAAYQSMRSSLEYTQPRGGGGELGFIPLSMAVLTRPEDLAAVQSK